MTPDGSKVDIQWSTTSDGQPLLFMWRGPSSGQNWATIGTVPSLGTKLSEFYAFQDSLPLNGTTYYRLHRCGWSQPDTPQVSPVESAHFTQPQTYLVNPNPVEGATSPVPAVSTSQHLALRLFTRDRKEVKEQEWSVTTTQASLQWNVEGLPSGLYFLEIVDDRGAHPQKSPCFVTSESCIYSGKGAYLRSPKLIFNQIQGYYAKL